LVVYKLDRREKKPFVAKITSISMLLSGPVSIEMDRNILTFIEPMKPVISYQRMGGHMFYQ
jgi:hypothetical protein